MKRKIILAALVAGALIAAGAAYAVVAHTTAASQTITACVSNEGGMRLAPATGDCRKNETVLTWNTVGPVGPAGANGLPGVNGQNGLNGQNGQNGRDATAINPDATDATLTVTGAAQGKIADAVAVSSVSHEIISPRDPASGLATGKRQHKPITITMQWGASTPLLIQALTTNENLKDVVIGFVKNGAQYATIELTNATATDYQQHGNTATFSFTYQKITWTWTDGGVTTQDDWQSPTA